MGPLRERLAHNAGRAPRWLTVAVRSLLPVTILTALSCADTRMVPATSAHIVPGAPETAAAEIAGLRISADGDDWTSAPTDLSKHLTPLKVRIVNHSGSPALITYGQFTLVDSRGHVYRAIPLLPLDHRPPLDGAEAIHPVYAASRFFVAPRFHDVYPTLDPWTRPLNLDDGFADELYRLWGGDLPTRTIRRLGLPEGVLADGGEISGFVYFENATRHEGRVTFRANIGDERNGAPLAEIKIPFRVQ
jgi:hypothetical protein